MSDDEIKELKGCVDALGLEILVLTERLEGRSWPEEVNEAYQRAREILDNA